MKDQFKDRSSDNLVKCAIDIINELSERGVNLFQKVMNTYQNMRVTFRKFKNISRDIRKSRHNSTSLCSHTEVRFVTEFVKKVPEGYEAMQKKEEIDIEKDYQTIGYIINKHICCDCGILLFSNEP
ncbi:unnamed protein product [marine sediment metagenome]|uniref:Uncharacterized protein n=1 Tax=marine sediment metagenome TaxID=412755 RepID=X1R8J3_9ZZZZ